MATAFPPSGDNYPVKPVGEDWTRHQKEIADRKPSLAVDGGTLTVAGFLPRRYTVEVEGRSLLPALSPPEVKVGGVVVTDLEFAADGRSLRGKLPTTPPTDDFLIDYRFASAGATLQRRTGWWHWIRVLLSGGWNLLDRLVQRGLSRLP